MGCCGVALNRPDVFGLPLLMDLKPEAISTVTVAPSLWWRIYPQQHGALGFNANPGGNARFSPLLGSEGIVTPTLYAASTPQVALMETVLHDLPTPSNGYILTLPLASDETRHMACMVNVMPLILADFSALGLRRLGLTRTQVIDTHKPQYPQTRTLAQWVFTHCPQAQGIQWTSRQDDRGLAIVLFEPRLATNTLHVWQEGESITVEHLQSELYALLDALGVGLV